MATNREKREEYPEGRPWALITGATSGFGKACAESLSKRGYSLILVGRRADRLALVKKKILTQSSPAEVVCARLDVRDRKKVFAWLKNIGSRLSKVDVLINNAGLALGMDKIQDGKIDDWDRMIDTNVKGLLYLTRGVVPWMLRRGSGHIVNIGSVAGRWVYPGGAVYCATKFAVRALSEGLRMDLIGTSIRVTNIEPGWADTEFSTVRYGSQKLADKQYLGMRPLSAEDVAECVAWSLSRPSHVNIQELVVFPTDQAALGQVHRSAKAAPRTQ